MRDGFERFRKRACEKDVAGFFKLVDRDKVIDALAASVPVSRKDAEQAYDETMREDWEKDIDRGDKGFLCAWEVARVVEPDAVVVKLVSGKTAKLRFEHRGADWFLVSYAVVSAKP